MGIWNVFGLDTVFDAIAEYGLDTNDWIVALSADTTTISDTTTLSDVSIAVLHSGSATVDWAGFLTINLGDSDATATLGNLVFTLQNTSESISLRQWFVFSGDDSTIIWAGALSPTITPPVSFPAEYTLENITVTLGQCSSPPPPIPTLIFSDSFSGSDTPLQDHSPSVGGSYITSGGSWSITFNTAQYLSSTSFGAAVTLPSESPDTIAVTLTTPASGLSAGGICFGSDSACSTYGLCGIYQIGSTGAYLLYGYVSGSLASLNAYAILPSGYTSGNHSLVATPTKQGWLVTIDDMWSIGPFFGEYLVGPYMGLFSYAESLASDTFTSLQMWH